MNLNEKDIFNKLDDIKLFMKSVIGSTVATYVLEIGDRHHKNIFLNDSQIKHIDMDWSLGKLYFT